MADTNVQWKPLKWLALLDSQEKSIILKLYVELSNYFNREFQRIKFVNIFFKNKILFLAIEQLIELSGMVEKEFYMINLK